MTRIAQPIVFGFALLACAGSTGHAAPADNPGAAKILGTYECHTGSSAAVTVDRPAKIEQRDPTNPIVRIAVSSLDAKARPEMKWWDPDGKAWVERRRAAKLWVQRVEFKDAYWAIMFEGASIDGLPMQAMLTNLPGASTRAAAPSEKPVFAITQLSSFFASASIYACDKL